MYNWAGLRAFSYKTARLVFRISFIVAHGAGWRRRKFFVSVTGIAAQLRVLFIEIEAGFFMIELSPPILVAGFAAGAELCEPAPGRMAAPAFQTAMKSVEAPPRALAVVESVHGLG